MNEVAASFGANLSRLRERSGVTQEELSFRASLHRTEIGLLERGDRLPRIDLGEAGRRPRSARSQPARRNRLGAGPGPARRLPRGGCDQRMRPTTKETSQNRNQEAKTRSKPTKNKAKTESQEKQEEAPQEAAKRRTQTATTNRRHTTHPFDSCLGRSLVIPNVRKASA